MTILKLLTKKFLTKSIYEYSHLKKFTSTAVYFMSTLLRSEDVQSKINKHVNQYNGANVFQA